MEVKSRSGVREVSRPLSATGSGSARLAVADVTSLLGLLPPLSRAQLMRHLPHEEQAVLRQWQEQGESGSLPTHLQTRLTHTLPQVLHGNDRVQLLSRLLLQEIARHKRQLRWQISASSLSSQDVKAMLSTLRASVEPAFSRTLLMRLEAWVRWLAPSESRMMQQQLMSEVESLTKNRMLQQLNAVERRLNELADEALPGAGLLVEIPSCAMSITVRARWEGWVLLGVCALLVLFLWWL